MNNESFINEKSQVANIAKEMAKLDLVSGSSGNVSMRMPNNKSGYMAITPMGLHYSELQDQNIVVVDEELDCIEEFAQLGRVLNYESELIEKKLSSKILIII